jgi:hypothetical protein
MGAIRAERVSDRPAPRRWALSTPQRDACRIAPLSAFLFSFIDDVRESWRRSMVSAAIVSFYGHVKAVSHRPVEGKGRAMVRGVRRAAGVMLFGMLCATAHADEVRIYEGAGDPMLKLRPVVLASGKTLNLSVGIGSGAFRAKDDPENMFWTVSDRGPNFTQDDAQSILGVPGDKLCGPVKPCRIYLAPDYAPSIYRVEVRQDGTFRIVDAVAIKTKSGVPVTGMLNPLTVASTENAVDGNGRPLTQDVNAIDAEGIVRLRDGSFWIGDENGPSILHVKADGTIQRRLVPAGTEQDFAGADYEVIGALPAILAKRVLNRGIESMAVSEDEKSLFFILQSPLANPDIAAFQDAANTRLLQIDRESLKPVAEYVYVMEPPAAWKGEETRRQPNVRISELIAIGGTRLLVDERTDQTTKIFEIDLAGASNILGSKWDDAVTQPSLEQTRLDPAGIRPVSKTMRFDSADYPSMPVKIEGVALFGDGSLMLINDDDFGISGGQTKIARVTGSKPTR